MTIRPATELDPGDVVAQRYRIEGVVGRGGFGAIYDATDSATGQHVALKVLLTNLLTSETDAKRFKREAALVQKLKHRNVVQLLDYGQTDRGLPFIAFELLRGQALEAILKDQGQLPAPRVAAIACDVLHALEAAHALAIVHRDIKPGNVFLCSGDGESEVAKVLDFGVAKATGMERANQTNLTRDGQLVGTPYYMAPEQVRGLDVSPQTDLYAVGLVMAEMLCGERVVAAPSVMAIYLAHISDEPVELPPAVTGTPLGPIVARAIEKTLPRRYPSARAMLLDLEYVVGQLQSGNAEATAQPAPPQQKSKAASPLLKTIPLAVAAPADAQPLALGEPAAVAPVPPRVTRHGTELISAAESGRLTASVAEAKQRLAAPADSESAPDARPPSSDDSPPQRLTPTPASGRVLAATVAAGPAQQLAAAAAISAAAAARASEPTSEPIPPPPASPAPGSLAQPWTPSAASPPSSYQGLAGPPSSHVPSSGQGPQSLAQPRLSVPSPLVPQPPPARTEPGAGRTVLLLVVIVLFGLIAAGIAVSIALVL
jgi:serine/threonine-protein kinase